MRVNLSFGRILRSYSWKIFIFLLRRYFSYILLALIFIIALTYLFSWVMQLLTWLFSFLMYLFFTFVANICSLLSNSSIVQSTSISMTKNSHYLQNNLYSFLYEPLTYKNCLLFIPLLYIFTAIASFFRFTDAKLVLHFVSAASSLVLYSCCTYMVIKNGFSLVIFQVLLSGIIIGTLLTQTWMRIIIKREEQKNINSRCKSASIAS